MRRTKLWGALGCLVAAGILAALSAGGEPPAANAPGARDHFPRNPLFYLELKEPNKLEGRLAAFRLWGEKEEAKKRIGRLMDLGAKQISMLLGKEGPEAGREILGEIKSLHVAVYPPLAFPPEPLFIAEVTDPEGLVKLLGAGGTKKLPAHRGARLYRLSLSLNGIRKTSTAAVSGKLVLLSPYELRVRQALDVAATRGGALPGSPGFAECAGRFSARPVWGYLNAQALAAAGLLDDMLVEDMQGALVALGLPSYRWAGFGSSLGVGKTPFEFHLEYFKWSPLAGLAPPAKAPDPSLAGAAPADALFYAALSVGDPVKAWQAVKGKILRATPAFDPMAEDDAGKEALDEMNEGIKAFLGADLEKDLLPLLSGELGCFVAGGDEMAFCAVLGARDGERAKQVMAKLKVRDGTVGTAGGEDGEEMIHVARVGRNVLLADNEDVIKSALAARAAKKTMADSKAYKAQMAALGEAKGLVVFIPAGNILKALEDGPDEIFKLLSKDYATASCAALTDTGLTWRSTGAVEAAMLLPMLAELDQIAREMERQERRRRLERIAAAATAFARKNRGRWPASFDELGPAFKAGSPARRAPSTRREFKFNALGTVPPKALRYRFLLCWDPGAEGTAEVVAVSGGRAHLWTVAGRGLAAKIKRDRAVLAVADPTRVKPTDEQKNTAGEAARDFGADDFPARDAATKKMRSLGLAAIPRLLELMGSNDPEVSSRAVLLLKELTGLKNKAEIRRLAP